MILLDTHVVIWWANGDRLRLSANALAAIDREIESAGQPGGSPGLLVSAISCWEMAMLVNRGRLALSLDLKRWLALLASHPAVRLLALDPAVAVAATRLPEPFHADPVDRFLVAQAREVGDSPTQRRQQDPFLWPRAQPLVSRRPANPSSHQRLHCPCWRSR